MKKWAQVRRARKMSQFALAERTGIPRWRIAFAEAGYQKLSRQQLEVVRRVLTADRREDRRQDRGSAAQAA